MASPIFDHLYQKKFQSAFNFHKFVSTCKNQAINLFYSGNLIDLKIHISRIKFFPWNLRSSIVFSINFHYRKNSGKLNFKIFQNIQETQFLDHFPQICEQKILFKKSISVMNNLMWISNTMPKFRKNY